MWWMLAASAVAQDLPDPGCRGRVSPRDSEIAFELTFEEEGKAPQTVTISPGAGPEEARGSVQRRLRGRMDAMQACYGPLVGVRGPTIELVVSFNVIHGRPDEVRVESATGDEDLRRCVREVVEQTPMLCKLDARGFAFALKFSAQ